MQPLLRATLLLLATLPAFFLSGCSALHQKRLRQTEAFYRASTLESFAPKPPQAQIPVLNSMPARSAVIGTFQYKTTRDTHFAIDAAVHNARKAGADAVVIRKIDERTIPFSYYIPPETVSIPRTRETIRPIWVKGKNGAPGHWEPGRTFETQYFLEHRPGRVVSGMTHETTIDAAMIRQK